MRIVVIGGVAAGMSAASQAKRRRPDAEVVVLERGPHVSYGACALPYNLADPERPVDDVVVFTAARFREERGIDVRTGHRAARLDPERRRVEVEPEGGEPYALTWDRLVIATGASPLVPPIPGRDLPGVRVLRTLEDGRGLKALLSAGGAANAVIVGGGYIGMEMAETLVIRGLRVTVVEAEEQVVPGLHPALAADVRTELERNGVEVATGAPVERIERSGDGLTVHTAAGSHRAELVLLAVGVRPNVALAKEAGIALGETGAVAVDDRQRTSLEDVWAAGDCAEAAHLVLGRPAWVPLGTTANKQGKVAGANAAGADERFGGIVGTAAFKVFGLEVGRTGAGPAELRRAEIDAVEAVSQQGTRAHGYPGGKRIKTVVFAEPGSGRLLGAQMVGGEAVAKRIDIFATALHARMTLEEVEGLDLSYAPPLAPVWDPVLIAAAVGRKAVAKGLRNNN